MKLALNFLILFVIVISINTTHAYAEDIPEWIKDVAELWVDGKVTDSEFINGMKYLIEQNIIKLDKNDKSIASFVDLENGAQYYIDRYNNESQYKRWFDENYPDMTIYEAVGLDNPISADTINEDKSNNESKTQKTVLQSNDSASDKDKSVASFVDLENGAQYYIDRYNNESQYKRWFDENYPDMTIYEAVGLDNPSTLEDDNLDHDLESQQIDDSSDESIPTTKTLEFENTLPSNISHISDFAIHNDPTDDQYTLRVSLTSPTLEELSADGKIMITFVDNLDTIVYSDEFSIKSTDFGIYEFRLTGEDFLAYVWTIPTSNVKQGVNSYGDAKVIFTDYYGNNFKSTTSVSIPVFTDEELTTKSNAEFQKTSSPIYLHIKDNGLKIELTRGGMFTDIKRHSATTYYRIDLTITNIGTNSIRFSPSSSIIQTIDNKQFDNAYGGTLERGNILPNSVVEGSILFEIDDDFENIKSVTLGNLIFDLVNNDVYTSEQLRSTEYEQNVININESLRDGSFKITLVKVGPYSLKKFSTTTDGFRVDFIVENKGSKAEYIPYDIVLLNHRGNQFEKSHSSNWDFKKIQPGVRYSGYVFFEEYVGDSPTITIIATQNAYPEDYTWSWNVDLAQ